MVLLAGPQRGGWSHRMTTRCGNRLYDVRGTAGPERGGWGTLALLNEITIRLLQEKTVTLLGGGNTLDEVDATAGPTRGG